MYSLQETFDISGLALVAQGGPAIDDECCFYLAPNDRRCAAGHLMHAPDDVLRNLVGFSDAEGNAELLDQHDPTLVRRLQRAHDTATIGGDAGWRAEWLRNVTKVAKVCDLDPSRVVAAAREAGWEVPSDL